MELGEGEEGSTYRVDRVVVAERLGEHILDARCLDHGAHSTARDNARTGRGGLEEHLASSVVYKHLMRDGGANEGHADHVLAGVFARLADCLRHFTRFAGARADGAVA